jgi:hypothetical protein
MQRLLRRTQVVKVVFGTLSLLCAIAVAFFGFALSQGERDILSSFLTVSSVLAVCAFALFGWSAVSWFRRKESSSIAGSPTSKPISGPASTVLLVLGVVLAFVGLPMLIDAVHRFMGSGMYDSAYGEGLRFGGYPAAEWPWFFAAGLVLTVSALVWKVRLRKARGNCATSA